jgi:hypothetical protein
VIRNKMCLILAVVFAGAIALAPSKSSAWFEIGTDGGLCGDVPRGHWLLSQSLWFHKSDYLGAYRERLKADRERESCLLALDRSKIRDAALLSNASDFITTAELAHAGGRPREAIQLLEESIPRLRARIAKIRDVDDYESMTAEEALKIGVDSMKGNWPIMDPNFPR